MNIFQLPRVDSDLTVFLVLDGQEYEVSEFISAECLFG